MFPGVDPRFAAVPTGAIYRPGEQLIDDDGDGYTSYLTSGGVASFLVTPSRRRAALRIQGYLVMTPGAGGVNVPLAPNDSLANTHMTYNHAYTSTYAGFGLIASSNFGAADTIHRFNMRIEAPDAVGRVYYSDFLVSLSTGAVNMKSGAGGQWASVADLNSLAVRCGGGTFAAGSWVRVWEEL